MIEILTELPVASHFFQSICTSCSSFESVGMDTSTSGRTLVILKGVFSTLFILMVAGAASGDAGPSIMSCDSSMYALTSPFTVSIWGAWPSIWKVTILVSWMPALAPGFSVMSTSAEAPGASWSGGAVVVVQPQPGTILVILTGLSRTLITLILPVLATSADISPRLRISGSKRMAWRASVGAWVGVPVCLPLLFTATGATGRSPGFFGDGVRLGGGAWAADIEVTETQESTVTEHRRVFSEMK